MPHLGDMAALLRSVVAPEPDFGAVTNGTDLDRIVGALLTYGLVFAVLTLIVCAAGWALGSATGSWQTASRAKAGVFAALAGSVLLGGALGWANWLLDLGTSL